MIRTVLVALSLAILLAAAGCGKGTPDKKASGENKNESKPPVEVTDSSRPKDDPKPAQKKATGETPDIVIKTENRVSNEEAGAMLDEVDKQLTELLNTLDRLDDLDDKNLQY